MKTSSLAETGLAIAKLSDVGAIAGMQPVSSPLAECQVMSLSSKIERLIRLAAFQIYQAFCLFRRLHLSNRMLLRDGKISRQSES